jgi:hypothetical protein
VLIECLTDRGAAETYAIDEKKGSFPATKDSYFLVVVGDEISYSNAKT